MSFSMQFNDGRGRRAAQPRRGSGWRADALILTLCVLGLLAADLLATGGQHTRAVIDAVGDVFKQSSTLVASVTRR